MALRRTTRWGRALPLLSAPMLCVLACGGDQEAEGAGGTSRPPAHPAVDSAPVLWSEVRLEFQCAEGRFTVAFPPGGATARLTLDGETVELEHVPSDSGTRYSNGSLVLWSKGREAVLERDGSSLRSGCRARRHTIVPVRE